MSVSKSGEVMNQQLDPKIRIRAPLRCQGIGRLDCAEHVESGMRMAVRWLPLDANGDAAARAVSALPEHPTLPTIRQTGKTGSAVYVAMDFPDGQMLSTLLSEPMPQERLVKLGAQLCDALATIHAQGVTHGELCAESVLLTHEKAILWDMPLVIANRLTDRRGEERLLAPLVRTAAYLAPERAMGGAASTAADVYALGAVLCVASGTPLSIQGNTLWLLHRVAQGEWAPAPVDTLSAPLRQLLARMVARQPSQRPSARQAAEELARLSLEPLPEPVAAVRSQPLPLEVAPVVVSAAPRTLLKAAALLLLAAGSAAALYWTFGRTPSSSTPVVPIATTPVEIKPAPVATVEHEETQEALLEPLPLQAAPPRAKVAAKPKAKPLAAKPSAKKRPEAAPVKYEPPKADDFGFLESEVAPPKDELKRPSF